MKSWPLITMLLASVLLAIIPGCDEETDYISSGIPNLLDPNVRPSVLHTYPPDGGVGPFNVYTPGVNTNTPHFFIQFNKLMLTVEHPPPMGTPSMYSLPLLPIGAPEAR